MRIANGTAIAWEEVSGHRVGQIEFKRLLNGVEGRKDNYELSIVRQEGEFHSPVHRHNFDQVRLPVSGRSSYAKNLYIHPGEIGYFPEGTFYGPQDINERTHTLVLQCGGASGQGFLGYQRLREGYEQLKSRGRFEDGKFYAADGAKPQDSYEAIWEHMNGRKLEYPAWRFRNPVIMDIAAFGWISAGTGVAHKQLGGFAERGVAIELYRLKSGASARLAAKPALRLLYVLHGAVSLDGTEAGAESAAEIGIGETPALKASAASEVLILGLPGFEQ